MPNLPLSLGNEEINKKQSKKAYYQRQESKNRPLLALYDTDEPCYQRTYARDTKGNKKDSKRNWTVFEVHPILQDNVQYDDQNGCGG